MPQQVVDEVNRRGIDVWGRSGAYHIHHAILNKGHVAGLDDEEKAKIHARCNLLKIPAEYNASHAKVPTWYEAYRILRKHYTKHEIHQWFNSIAFKEGPPFRLPED